jgi:hypothetical protein
LFSDKFTLGAAVFGIAADWLAAACDALVAAGDTSALEATEMPLMARKSSFYPASITIVRSWAVLIVIWLQGKHLRLCRLALTIVYCTHA